MRGNVYFYLDNDTYNSIIPEELSGSYGVHVYNEEGEITSTTRPTFKELGEINIAKFGHVTHLKIGSAKYHVLELEISWINSEASALIALGDGLASPRNTLMNRSESSRFLKNN